MALRRDVLPDLANPSVGPDPERHAHDSEKGFPEERFHPPRAVGFDDVEFGVRQERKVQLVLDLELRLRLDGVAARADDRGVELFELLDGVTKLGRFVRSTGCIGLRIKIQDHVLAAKIGERDLFAIVGDRVKVRGLVAFLEHFRLFICSRHISITQAAATKFHSRFADSPDRAFPA